MCGIIGGFVSNLDAGIKALEHRGPDAAGFIHMGNFSFGHTRLSIIDLDPRSNQPFTYQGLTIVFNGEIWNYKALRHDLEAIGYQFTTQSDTEVLAASLLAWEPKGALNKIQGMFAVAWSNGGAGFYLARDRFGEVPLHIARQKPFLFASEIKGLLAEGAHPKSFDMFPPGHYAKVEKGSIQLLPYYNMSTKPQIIDIDAAAENIHNLINLGTTERTISDVPICTLLSGGIDSAAVAYFLKQHFTDLTAYTAVYDPKSHDLKSARIVAESLDIDLIEINVPAPSINDLAAIIYHIEMPYKAQIEIGWPCLKLAEAMRTDGFKVVFSGEGSDELWGSYGFAYHGLKDKGWHEYRKDLFLSQHRKNFSRCNKIFMTQGIECRLPFLNTQLVECAISLPKHSIQDGNNRPKAVIQKAFSGKLPNIITTRPKVAFQDGMGIKQAVSEILPSPKRFYNSEYKNQYG